MGAHWHQGYLTFQIKPKTKEGSSRCYFRIGGRGPLRIECILRCKSHSSGSASYASQVVSHLNLTVVANLLFFRGSGCVALMSSSAGKAGVPFSGTYTGSKHGDLHKFPHQRVQPCTDTLSLFVLRRWAPASLSACSVLDPHSQGSALHTLDSQLELCICTFAHYIFSSLLEVAATETPGQSFGESMKSTDKRMTAERWDTKRFLHKIIYEGAPSCRWCPLWTSCRSRGSASARSFLLCTQASICQEFPSGYRYSSVLLNLPCCAARVVMSVLGPAFLARVRDSRNAMESEKLK